jgi:hypothetical protein
MNQLKDPDIQLEGLNKTHTKIPFRVAENHTNYKPLLRDVPWLQIPLCILEIPGSNLGPDTDYPDKGSP